jgi:2',3'-cyclic-nucleotide 2'-phosphodiesterase (5'-nucleotidase family)
LRVQHAARALVLALLVAAGFGLAGDAAPGRVALTILQTSDLHGRLLPWDYFAEKEDAVGLARIGTLVANVRRESPNVLLLDAGDTIQGTPISFLHAKDPSKGPDPMAQAMSALRYDAMAVGNHEFNFGLHVLRKAEKESSFPWLSANTRNAADGSAAFPEYIVKTLGGVRVGILGLTTPAIPGWEPETNRPGLRWEDPVVTAKRLVPVLRGKERCDFVVVLIHSGPEADLVTLAPDGTEQENRAVALARGAPGIDLLLTGHTHRKIPLTKVAGVPMIQPGRWGEVLARVDVAFERRGKRMRPVSVTADLVPVDHGVASDPAIVRIAEPHDRAARAYMDETVVLADAPFPAEGARLGDSALLELVNETQRAATGADLSMTSLLPTGRYAGLPAGPVKIRDVYALYPYENQLVVVEIDGAILKSLLERAAEFFDQPAWEGTRLVVKPKEGMVPYNFDVIEGVSYRIDPLAPAGSRVKGLAYQGRAVTPEDRFTLAVNSYRAQGAGGYTALKGTKVVRRVSSEIRELLIEHLRKRGRIAPKLDHNWLVAPDTVFAEGAFSARTN